MKKKKSTKKPKLTTFARISTSDTPHATLPAHTGVEGHPSQRSGGPLL